MQASIGTWILLFTGAATLLALVGECLGRLAFVSRPSGQRPTLVIVLALILILVGFLPFARSEWDIIGPGLLLALVAPPLLLRWRRRFREADAGRRGGQVGKDAE